MKTNRTLILRIALGGALILLAAFSALPLIPPRAVSADAPAARFSAGRAMGDLQVVARESHGSGSAAQARVRDYIASQVAALGLSAEIQASGQVENILVRLPGSNPTLTVLVTGHYDSNGATPGAGDDGLSTVAMLESIRVLHASSPLRNDILFLFTDGEELGWLGARAFIREYPGARQDMGVVLCFDGLPGNAPLVLRQTSPGDAWLVREMTGLPLRLWTGSWQNPAERTDTDTDFESFQAAGFTGVEIENEKAGIRYHTDLDTVGAISPDLVQSFGESMLTLANHFGSIDLRAKTNGPDMTFFSLPLAGLMAHPSWVTPGLSGLGIAALLAFVVVAWRGRQFSPKRFLLSVLGLVAGILLITLVAQLAWGVVTQSHRAEVAAYGGFDTKAGWLSGFMIGATVLMIGLLTGLSRRLGGVTVAAAGAAVYLIFALALYVLIQGDNPITTAYITWPFVGSVAALGVLLFTKNPVWKVVLLLLSALLMLILVVPYLVLGTYTPEDAWVPIVITCVMLSLFAPQVDGIFGRALTNAPD